MPLPSLEGLASEDVARLAQVAAALANNPQTRSGFQRLYKQVDPTVVLPELDMEEALAKQREQFHKELEDRDKKAEQERLVRQRTETLRDLVDSGLLARDDIAIDKESNLSPIEKFALDNKIGDYQSAARLYKQSLGAATPTNSSPSFVPSAPTVPKIDLGDTGNLRQWSLNEAYKAVDEIRRGTLKTDERGFPLARQA
jgi:hypothetical protein